MKTLLRTTLLLALAAVLASPLMAADDKKKPQKGNKGRRNPAANAVKFPKGVEASEEQQAALKKLQEEFSPQLVALNKKQRDILTTDQIKARAAARKQAVADGKKGKDVRDAVAAAGEITAEQKTQLAALQKERRALTKKIQAAVVGLLTDEQKAKLPKRQGGTKKGAAKKDAAKKDAA